jgi:hypothetical protein
MEHLLTFAKQIFPDGKWQKHPGWKKTPSAERWPWQPLYHLVTDNAWQLLDAKNKPVDSNDRPSKALLSSMKIVLSDVWEVSLDALRNEILGRMSGDSEECALAASRLAIMYEHLGQQGGVQPAADVLSADNRQSAANITEGKVHEGYDQDRTNTFRTRNAEIIARRKAYDDFTCLSCGLRLCVNGVFIIDCHHKYPIREGDRVTNLDDLICLCPTCHRIAHSRISPLSVSETQAARQAAGLTIKSS